jgi:hypothetical protein
VRSLQDDERQGQDDPGRKFGKLKMMEFIQWTDRPVYLHFAGTDKGKQKASPDGRLVSSTWTEATDGYNMLKDAVTSEAIASVHSNSYIWAADCDPLKMLVVREDWVWLITICR